MSQYNGQLTNIVEAMLFAAAEPLSARAIARVIEDAGKTEIGEAVAALNQRYTETAMSFRVREVAGGYQLHTLPEYSKFIELLLARTKKQRLSAAALETLAVIAYRQPVTTPELEKIRGVESGGVLHTLLERKLISIVGRSDKPGRPLLYGSTPEFLYYFGLNNLNELPRIDELTDLLKDKEHSEQLGIDLAEPIESDNENAATADTPLVAEETAAISEVSAEDSKPDEVEKPAESDNENTDTVGTVDMPSETEETAATPEVIAENSELDESEEPAESGNETAETTVIAETTPSETEETAPTTEVSAEDSEPDEVEKPASTEQLSTRLVLQRPAEPEKAKVVSAPKIPAKMAHLERETLIIVDLAEDSDEDELADEELLLDKLASAELGEDEEADDDLMGEDETAADFGVPGITVSPAIPDLLVAELNADSGLPRSQATVLKVTDISNPGDPGGPNAVTSEETVEIPAPRDEADQDGSLELIETVKKVLTTPVD